MAHPWYTQPLGFEIPATWQLPEESRGYMLSQLWEMLLTGESDVETYLDLVNDEFTAANVSAADVERFFTEMVTLRREQQEALGGPPPSALSAAFAELETIGVLARENFACCGTCATAEIGDERDDSRQWRGYVYYHAQDAERIPHERQTYIGYGAFLG